MNAGRSRSKATNNVERQLKVYQKQQRKAETASFLGSNEPSSRSFSQKISAADTTTLTRPLEKGKIPRKAVPRKEHPFWQTKEFKQLKYRVIQLSLLAQQIFFTQLAQRYQLIFLTLLPRQRVVKLLSSQQLQAKKEMLGWLSKIKIEDVIELQKLYNNFFHNREVEVNGHKQLQNIYGHLPKETQENLQRCAVLADDKHSAALQRLVGRFNNAERALLLSDPRLTYNVLSLLSQSNKILCLQKLIDYTTLSPREKQQQRCILLSYDAATLKKLWRTPTRHRRKGKLSETGHRTMLTVSDD